MACESQAGNLASITSSELDVALFSEAQLLTSSSNPFTWFGYNDISIEGTFVWEGPPSTFTNWWSGEPNDAGGGEDCAHQYAGPGSLPVWNDLPCSQEHFAWCEASLPPLPPFDETQPCVESESSGVCHELAGCSKTETDVAIPSGIGIVAAEVTKNPTDGLYSCWCYPEQLGHGYGPNGCSTTGYSVRIVYNGYSSPRLSDDDEADLLELLGVTCTAGSTECDHVYYTMHGSNLGVNVLFHASAQSAANTAANNFNAAPSALRRSATYPDTWVERSVGARVYAWNSGTTGSPLALPPAGMEVQAVAFDSSCAKSGCWVIDVAFTVGHSDVAVAGQPFGFNTFYLPFAPGSDALSYDYGYTTTILETFEPRNFPCRVSDYDGSESLPVEATLCCFGSDFTPDTTFPHAGADSDHLLGRYRVSTAFQSYALGDFCPGDVPVFPEDVAPDYATALTFWEMGTTFVDMPDSPGITNLTATDAYVGMYKATIELDEVELRTKAGLLTGTVGVEHTVDFFLGWANFKPATTTKILDTLAAQTAIHVEKTSFFSVSTHGVNDYTFLEYVNMRLVAVYEEDADFSGTGESGDRTVRTASGNQANYVQVTFTLGSQYNVDPAGSPLIPSTSVRAGHGTFFDTGSPDLLHMCTLWGASDSRFDATTGTLDFSDLLTTQDCSPAASMCASPSSIPDSFVVYNIPLGMDYFEGTAGGASPTLSNNIFVEMVVSAAESGATREDSGAPNSGGDPQQMKTTLTASIPIVEGGVNIFCDGFTAKTDLEDVADADIVVGSASDASELTRLRILKDIASTQMNPNEITEINSDSIEAGLMTLVLKGNASYFGLSGRGDVSIELEDVITIHIMEDTGSGAGTSKDSFVLDKLNDAPDDNLDSSGLKVDGYCLNGAFCFEIDRASQRAHLEPTAALLAECPFNPPRPDPGAMELETCVTRRDVRYREFPARTGAFSTAMEICSGGKGSCGLMSDEQWFFTTILGNNDYAKSLATSYANVIADEYNLNGVYRRAYWINPGYEWTPTQTGGTPIFSVSQKLYLFALITMDESLTGNTGASLGYANPVLPGSRRRMLLQNTPSNVNEALQDGQSEAGGGVFEFQTSPSQLMAKTFKVPEERVSTFKLQLQLTQAEACMSTTELQSSLRSTLDDYMTGVASPYHTVQVVAMSVDKADVQCRRSIRSLHGAYSAATAEVTMLVVFKEGQDAKISLAKLQGMAGVQSVEPLSVSPSVDTTVAVDDTSVLGSPNTPTDDEGGSSSNVALIAGAAAGGTVAVVAIIAGVFFLRKRSEPPVIEAVQSINVDDLKSQLAADA